MVYGCGSFIITFEESVVNFSLQDSNMKGGSGNVEERENIRERLKKHKLSYVWLIGQLALRGIVTDKTEMSSVISGTRNGTKADAIIELSIMIQAAVSRVSPATETKGKTIRRWQAKNTTSVICPVCGQTFVLCSAAQRYCSSACREKAREQCKARQEAAKEKKKNAGKDLETVVAQAERLGMSYGKYRAMQAISAASIHAKTT
jgi:hypothetical protein